MAVINISIDMLINAPALLSSCFITTFLRIWVVAVLIIKHPKRNTPLAVVSLIGYAISLEYKYQSITIGYAQKPTRPYRNAVTCFCSKLTQIVRAISETSVEIPIAMLASLKTLNL